jgi:hypothetical protein
MPPPDEALDARSAWAQQWRDWWLHAGAFQRAGLDWVALCSDPALRNRWLAGLGQMFDRYARSPGFLELTRHNLRALAAIRGLSVSTQPRQELRR